ncbi:hypothetical protein GCM10010405_50320 [Streptomyces macrosporus]|uniref:Uncharacterized protein n=1 Tax=Streptomyces macrosporus TaxID=44032 RepID=A0ABP5XM54_9ACTN
MSFVVAVPEPGVERGGAFVVAGKDSTVGPFGLQGPVEALDFAVLPWAVRLDELLPGAAGGADLGGEYRWAQALSVISRWIRLMPCLAK